MSVIKGSWEKWGIHECMPSSEHSSWTQPAWTRAAALTTTLYQSLIMWNRKWQSWHQFLPCNFVLIPTGHISTVTSWVCGPGGWGFCLPSFLCLLLLPVPAGLGCLAMLWTPLPWGTCAAYPEGLEPGREVFWWMFSIVGLQGQWLRPLFLRHVLGWVRVRMGLPYTLTSYRGSTPDTTCLGRIYGGSICPPSRCCSLPPSPPGVPRRIPAVSLPLRLGPSVEEGQGGETTWHALYRDDLQIRVGWRARCLFPHSWEQLTGSHEGVHDHISFRSYCLKRGQFQLISKEEAGGNREGKNIHAHPPPPTSRSFLFFKA